MKNVYILPTDKPSKLYLDENKKLQYIPVVQYNYNNCVNIFITSSDEEIKEGVSQWYLDKFLNKPRNSSGSQYGEKQNVIILTTDPDLIKDGVQSIPDEFLEWLIKNPSCDSVEVEIICGVCGVEGKEDEIDVCGRSKECFRGWISDKYKIIIPQQKEVGQVTEKGVIDVIGNCANCGVEFHIHKNITEFKQETLEEASETFYQKSLKDGLELSFYDGVKFTTEYRQERMYSEEEVYKIAKNAFELYRNDNLDDEELEQEFERVIKIWLKKK